MNKKNKLPANISVIIDHHKTSDHAYQRKLIEIIRKDFGNSDIPINVIYTDRRCEEVVKEIIDLQSTTVVPFVQLMRDHYIEKITEKMPNVKINHLLETEELLLLQKKAA